jgi:chromosomal replication initiation ATPase DnaA
MGVILMDIQKVWNDALKEIKDQISKPSFETWFKATKPLSLEGNTFVLEVPHAFAADWLKSRYGKMIEEVLQKVTGNAEIKLKTAVGYSEKEEKLIYDAVTSEVDALGKIEDRLDRIEKKLDELLELLKNKAADS